MTDTHRILVAEDNPINQRVIIGMLKKIGFSAAIANNGTEVLEALEKDSYELIFMDCQMPVMDGYKATESIREFDKDIPIVALTANAMPGDKEKCITSGMNDYISKPINIVTIQEVVNKYLP